MLEVLSSIVSSLKTAIISEGFRALVSTTKEEVT